MIVNSTIFQTKALTTFFVWYFLEVPRDIFVGLGKYLKTITYVFSFVYLLRTLFAHWKGLRYAYPSKGFDITNIMQAFGSNMISRIVGAMVRISTIIFGCILMAVVTFAGIACFVVWLTFPILFVFLLLVSADIGVL